MIQALHAILGTAGDESRVAMLYGNTSTSNILAGAALDAWAASSNGRFKLTHGATRYSACCITSQINVPRAQCCLGSQTIHRGPEHGATLGGSLSKRTCPRPQTTASFLSAARYGAALSFPHHHHHHHRHICALNCRYVPAQPPMYESICGPRSDVELSGVLFALGYTASMVYKF
jgi:hypothetical protein